MWALEEQQEARTGVTDHSSSIVTETGHCLTSRWIVDRTPKPLHERRFSCGHTRWLSRGKWQQGKTPNPDGVRGSVDGASEETESIFCDAEVVLPPSSSCSPNSTCTNLNEVALVTVASLDHLNKNGCINISTPFNLSTCVTFPVTAETMTRRSPYSSPPSTIG